MYQPADRRWDDHCAGCDPGYRLVGNSPQRCEVWSGSCADGSALPIAQREGPDHCATCDPGYSPQYTKVTGVKWCSGGNDNVGDVWGTGLPDAADSHCPLIPTGVSTLLSNNHPTYHTAAGNCKTGEIGRAHV